MWNKTGIKTGFSRQSWGKQEVDCLSQLILDELCQLIIETMVDDFSCLPPQLPECGTECCQISCVNPKEQS